MHLAVISPPTLEPGETALVEAMVESGLERYHVRRPGVTLGSLRTWIGRFSERARRSMVLHQHHVLVSELGLLGRHWRAEDAKARPDGGGNLSRSCHDLPTLQASLGLYDAVLVAPVFASISKPGHGPAAGTDWLAWMRALTGRGTRSSSGRTVVYALGGVDETRIEACREAGFGGVAVLGAVWQSDDPLKAFLRLRDAVAREQKPKRSE